MRSLFDLHDRAPRPLVRRALAAARVALLCSVLFTVRLDLDARTLHVTVAVHVSVRSPQPTAATARRT